MFVQAYQKLSKNAPTVFQNLFLGYDRSVLFVLISDLWIMAAKWEFEENKNIPNSRSLLQKGLRVNPSSQKLWLEVILYWT